ncbi:Putative RxLR effector [Phytophthora palmivora]|uniref:RxLR effector protein n=1 Tax=Phytophthora palmivora TaxID=4796 RepID=A0A2P4Y769_9STRA|nr:Putative RxLR effector [Phytophthora palmivora]
MVMTIRFFFYVALATAVLTSNAIVSATKESQLVSKSGPDIVATNQIDFRVRFLRVPREQVDDKTSRIATNEERTKSTGQNIIKELKIKNENLKKLAVAANKAQTSPQRLAAVAKKMKRTPPKAPPQLNSVEYQKFARLFKENQTPELLRKLGKLKHAMLAKYEEFHKAATIALKKQKTAA